MTAVLKMLRALYPLVEQDRHNNIGQPVRTALGAAERRLGELLLVQKYGDSVDSQGARL